MTPEGPDRGALDVATPQEPDTAPDEVVADPAAQDEARSQRRLPPLAPLLPWVLVILAVVVAAVATWRWQELAAVERDREDVAATTSDVVSTLTTWDAGDDMGDTRDALIAAGTERFAGDVDQLFGSTADLAALQELGIRSDGDVRDVYVQALQGDAAEVLAVVVQQITSGAADAPETTVRYARTVLERRDGEWLVDEIELLVEALDPGTEPGGGVVQEPADEGASS